MLLQQAIKGSTALAKIGSGSNMALRAFPSVSSGLNPAVRGI